MKVRLNMKLGKDTLVNDLVRNNYENTPIAGCRNAYTPATINSRFCESEEEIKVCNGCNSFKYEDGIMTCSKM